MARMNEISQITCDVMSRAYGIHPFRLEAHSAGGWASGKLAARRPLDLESLTCSLAILLVASCPCGVTFVFLLDTRKSLQRKL